MTLVRLRDHLGGTSAPIFFLLSFFTSENGRSGNGTPASRLHAKKARVTTRINSTIRITRFRMLKQRAGSACDTLRCPLTFAIHLPILGALLPPTFLKFNFSHRRVVTAFFFRFGALLPPVFSFNQSTNQPTDT